MESNGNYAKKEIRRKIKEKKKREVRKEKRKKMNRIMKARIVKRMTRRRKRRSATGRREIQNPMATIRGSEQKINVTVDQILVDNSGRIRKNKSCILVKNNLSRKRSEANTILRQ